MLNNKGWRVSSTSSPFNLQLLPNSTMYLRCYCRISNWPNSVCWVLLSNHNLQFCFHWNWFLLTGGHNPYLYSCILTCENHSFAKKFIFWLAYYSTPFQCDFDILLGSQYIRLWWETRFNEKDNNYRKFSFKKNI